MCIGRNWEGMRVLLFVLQLRGDTNGDSILFKFNVGLCLGVVFVLWWCIWWYLDRPVRRGNDFCSDIGDKSDDVLDCVPWYIKPGRGWLYVKVHFKNMLI